MALVLTAALSVSMSQAGGRTALLSGLCAGLFFGLTSVIGYLTHDMAEKFQPVAASLAVFLILGLLFGSFAEAVRVLHRAIHRPDDLK